jgi:hypothetical protein
MKKRASQAWQRPLQCRNDVVNLPSSEPVDYVGLQHLTHFHALFAGV